MQEGVLLLYDLILTLQDKRFLKGLEHAFINHQFTYLYLSGVRKPLKVDRQIKAQEKLLVRFSYQAILFVSTYIR